MHLKSNLKHIMKNRASIMSSIISAIRFNRPVMQTFAPKLHHSWYNVTVLSKCFQISGNCCLKGLGHAILGNFSTDQMVIELTKI